MPLKPFAVWPASTTLGVTLLGLSATLFAVDVGATIALDNDRAAAAGHADPVVMQRIGVPALVPSRTALQRGSGRDPSHAPQITRPHGLQLVSPAVVAVAAVATDKHALVQHVPVQRTAARHAAATSVPMPESFAPHRSPAFDRSVTPDTPALASGHGAEAGGASMATLREVRQYVMRDLDKSHKRVCVISAMTYPYAADNRRVIVDLVYRDDKGRWSEKAVVKRGGSGVQIIGVKQHALPYRAVASSGIAPTR